MTDILVRPHSFPNKESICMLPGTQGSIEGIIAPAKDLDTNKAVVICHPNPLEEGTMHNKVVYIAAKAYSECGFHTLRFNFRGVGRSDGTYGDVVGEIEDLQSVVAWLKQVNPNLNLHLAGFSFGGYIAANLAQQDENICSLVTIAPAVDRHNFHGLKPINKPWLIIQGSDDEVIHADLVQEFVRSWQTDIAFELVNGASHFFHSKLQDVKAKIVKWVTESNFS